MEESEAESNSEPNGGSIEWSKSEAEQPQKNHTKAVKKPLVPASKALSKTPLKHSKLQALNSGSTLLRLY